MDKTCTKCGKTKNESFFVKSGRNLCLECNNEYHREYDRLHPRIRKNQFDPNDNSLKKCSICGIEYPRNLTGWHATVCPKCKAQKAKAYRDANKDMINARCKVAYYSDGKEERDARRRSTRNAWYNKDIEKSHERNKRQYWKNVDKNRIKSNEYYRNHKEDHYAKSREWILNNRDKYREYNRNWARKQSENPYNKVVASLRARLRDGLVNCGLSKNEHTMDLVGCDLNWLIIHLQRQFKDGMSWENYGRGGWVIDHIIPVSAFDLNDEDQRYICFGWQNLQPLWEKENASKGDLMPDGTRARNIA